LDGGQAGEFWDDSYSSGFTESFWAWFLEQYGEYPSEIMFGLERVEYSNIDFYAIIQDVPKGACSIIPILAALGLMANVICSGVATTGRRFTGGGHRT
jgi:hypothetical protein